MKSIKEMTDAEVVAAYNQLQASKREREQVAKAVRPFDAAMIGAGRTFDDMAMGLKQGVMKAGSVLGIDAATRELADMQGEEAYKKAAYEGLAKERPVATGVGSVLPLLTIPAARSMGGAAASGALPGLLGYGSLQEKLVSGGIGGVGGALGKMAGDKIVRAFAPGLDAKAASRAATAAQKGSDLDDLAAIGIKPTIGEATGSRSVQHLENLVGGMFLGGKVGDVQHANRKALTAAVNKQMGETGDVLTEDVTAAAAKRIGQEFERMRTYPPVPFKLNDIAAIQGVSDDLLKAHPSLLLPDVSSMARRAGGLADDLRGTPAMTGGEYVASRAALNDIIGDKSNQISNAAGRLKGIIDDARKGSLNGGQFDEFMRANEQYANMKAVERLATGSVDGTVSPKGVFQATRNAGGDELRELARLARSYVSEVPDSGTAQKSQIANALLGGASVAAFSPIPMLAPLAVSHAVTNPTLARAAAVQIPKAMGKLSAAQKRMLEYMAERAPAVTGGLLGQATGANR